MEQGGLLPRDQLAGGVGKGWIARQTTEAFPWSEAPRPRRKYASNSSLSSSGKTCGGRHRGPSVSQLERDWSDDRKTDQIKAIQMKVIFLLDD
jgi:hypothetical protein